MTQARLRPASVAPRYAAAEAASCLSVVDERRPKVALRLSKGEGCGATWPGGVPAAETQDGLAVT